METNRQSITRKVNEHIKISVGRRGYFVLTSSDLKEEVGGLENDIVRYAWLILRIYSPIIKY